jgi:hypothetical protein
MGRRLAPFTTLLVTLSCLGHLRAQDPDNPHRFGIWDPGSVPPPSWIVPVPTVPELEALRRPEEPEAPWLSSEPGQEPLTNLRSKTDGPLGSLTSQVILRDPRAARDEPLPVSAWRTDGDWKMGVAGPLFLFGQMGAAPEPWTADELKVNGKTGLGCKLPLLLGAEVLLRGGPAVTCTDPLRPVRGREHSELFVEVQCRCPLPGKVGLEYQGAAVPALSPAERDRINQDLRVAFPLGDAGQFRVGAKHQWENSSTPRDWKEGMQLYLGVELKPPVPR